MVAATLAGMAAVYAFWEIRVQAGKRLGKTPLSVNKVGARGPAAGLLRACDGAALQTEGGAGLRWSCVADTG